MHKFGMAAVLLGSVLMSAPVVAAPEYDQGPDDLKWVLTRMIEWLPGEWSAFPHVHHNRTVRMPEVGGEHEDWHRSITLIDAPQVGGDAVFYAQITIGGRDGPLLGRTQYLYKIWVDEDRGVVVLNGQGLKDPDRFVDLGERPELWREVEMRDEAGIRCDFIWRRNGDQVFGVLEGKTPERQKYGPGTCTYISEAADVEFFADAEWVLSADSLWLYDINKLRGIQFVGREDGTHTRYLRARPYSCAVEDADGKRVLDGHDRGFRVQAATRTGERVELMLLRTEYADEREGRADALRLMMMQTYPEPVMNFTQASGAATSITLEHLGVNAVCTLQDAFAPINRED